LDYLDDFVEVYLRNSFAQEQAWCAWPGGLSELEHKQAQTFMSGGSIQVGRPITLVHE